MKHMRLFSLLLFACLLAGLCACARTSPPPDDEAVLLEMQARLAEFPKEGIAQEVGVIVLPGEPYVPDKQGWTMWEKFLKRAAKGKDAEIIVVTRTTEGDPILHYLRCRGGRYYAATDFTRDGFGGIPPYELGAFETFTVSERTAEEAFGDRVQWEPGDYLLGAVLEGRLWSDGVECQMHDSYGLELWMLQDIQEKYEKLR